MLAVHLENGRVETREVPLPPRPEGFALLRLLVAGICNTDLELQRGYYGFSGTPGHEFVAEVVEADTRELIGKRVVGEINLACRHCEWCRRGLGRHCPTRTVLGIVNHPGAFAEFLTLPEANLHVLPDSVPTERAVFTEPLAAACEILDQVTIPPGSEVAVLGDGKLGILIALVLEANGYHVHHFGHHQRYCVSTDPPPAAAFDWVVDATGSAEGLRAAVAATRPRGTLILKSTVHGLVPVDTAPIIVNELTLVGSRCGRFEASLPLLDHGVVDVEPMIADRFPLAEAPRAFARAATRGVLKVLLTGMLLMAAAFSLLAQSGENILLVVNRNDAASREIAEYYRPRRAVPEKNVCTIATTSNEEIQWATYEKEIERPIGDCLKKAALTEKVLYIVTTLGVPLKIDGNGTNLVTERASVDSELALLYGKLHGQHFERAGMVGNPFFMKREERFAHPRFPIYLVTRLAAWDVADAKAMIDRSLAAKNRGKFVVDLSPATDAQGNDWLKTAAILLPEDRTVIDETKKVLYLQPDVIGYASWGSNDPDRHMRILGFRWLPGAVATEFVSTNGRTFKRPPDNWALTTWNDRAHLWDGSPQGLTGDLIHEGATGASGNVYEPFLAGCVRPDYLLPAYYQGHNLAESYYVAMPYLSWQGIVIGDPLCSLGKP